MNFIKKVLLLVFIYLFIFSFLGCSRNKIPVNIEQSSKSYVANEDFQNYLNLYSNMAMTDDGYYFINNNHLNFFDKKTHKIILVCNKVNCEHSDDVCMAYISPFDFYQFQLSYYDNSLYLIGWETEGANIHHNYIYQINLNTFKRKKAAFLNSSNGLSSIVFIVHRGYAYFVYGGSTMKDSTAALYRIKLGNSSKKDSAEKIYEISGVNAQIFGLSAYGNYVFFTSATYEDTDGNGYKTSLNSIDIHSLTPKTVIENNQYSYFAEGGYIYYEKDKNTVNCINLTTNEENFFCNIDGPCYISADENFLYFDNQQSIYIDDRITDRRIFVIDKKSGEKVSEIIPKDINDECLFGGSDFLIFRGITEKNTSFYYAYDKSKLPVFDGKFIEMN